jgi:hypothetical protein
MDVHPAMPVTTPFTSALQTTSKSVSISTSPAWERTTLRCTLPIDVVYTEERESIYAALNRER